MMLRKLFCTLFVLLLLLATTSPAQAQTFFVNSIGDAPDDDPGDELCATVEGECTLRAAIQEADATPNEGGDPAVINFSAAPTDAEGHVVIDLDDFSLPRINDAVEILGDTAPGFDEDNPVPIVILDGAPINEATNLIEGFEVGTGGEGTVIRSVAVYGFDGGIRLRVNEVTVQGCYIGLDVDGTTPRPNLDYGIRIGSSENVIGRAFDPETGTFTGLGNVISGNGGDNSFSTINTRDGLYIDGGANWIFGNRIGTSADGTQAVGNQGHGVRMVGTGASNEIGSDLSAEAGNVISGNDSSGVRIDSNLNFVRRNKIGTDAAGTSTLGNQRHGLLVLGDQNFIGGNSSNSGNVIGGNALTGDFIGGLAIGQRGDPANNNIIENNYIGVSPSGDDIGNGDSGIRLEDANNNQVGTPGNGNVIGFNGASGISVSGGVGNTFKSNFVGVTPEGEEIGNRNAGIGFFLTSTANAETVVGHPPGEEVGFTGNVIAFNEDGVSLSNAIGPGIAIRGNQIFGNSVVGIDNNGADCADQDAGDGDEGPNRCQNFPEIDEADYDEDTGEITLTYAVPTAPANATYPLVVDFYRTDADQDEGQIHLGTDLYAESDFTDGPEKTITFTPPVGVSVTRADHVLATATDQDGNTSEFSEEAAPLPVELASFEAAQSGEEVRLTWRTLSEQGSAAFQVQRAAVSGDDGATRRAASLRWKTIGEVEAAGTTTEAQSYTFTDEDLPFEAQALAYRLVQHDRDGGREILAERTVEVGAPQQFTLHGAFPNPVRARATIRYELPEERRVRVALYDVLGRKVKTLVDEVQSGRQEVTVAAGGLASGVYFYRLTAGDYHETRRLVVLN